MRIYVEEIEYHGIFNARRDLPDGEIIVKSSRQPLLDAARTLQREGMSGTLEMWDALRPYPRMTGDIDKLAQLTITERDRSGIRIEPWKVDSRYAIASPAAREGVGQY